MTDENVEQWKIKRLIQNLDNARGNGTSMISLVLRPREDISKTARMLAEEQGTASCIKSRVNRLSVLSAISSAQQRLKLYNKTPPNGLVVYCGLAINEEGKERKIAIDFEPFRPINTTLYKCDNRFNVDALKELLENDDKFGFIIVDGSGAQFSTLQGDTRDTLNKFSVILPKKHGRGGQSAPRFARIRMEKRHNYVRKVAETATQLFISQDKVNVAGLVLAGSADFKNELAQSDLLDARLQQKILKIVDVSYGGDNGFNQAIELSTEALSNVKLVREKKILAKFNEEVALETGKIAYGIQETMDALESGACETVIVWESLAIMRYFLRNPVTGETLVKYLRPEQNQDTFLKTSDGVELDVQEKGLLSEWLVDHYMKYGAHLEFVTDRSSEGTQFVEGFGGLGGLLRYKAQFEAAHIEYDDSDTEFM